MALQQNGTRMDRKVIGERIGLSGCRTNLENPPTPANKSNYIHSA